VAELTIFVQVGLGSRSWAVQHHKVAQFHAFYGFVAIATVGIVYSYRQQLVPHRYCSTGWAGSSSWASPSAPS